jgi:hypothetical protein
VSSVQQQMACVPVTYHPPHSPHFTSAHLRLFPKGKDSADSIALRFSDVEGIKSSMNKNILPDIALQGFTKWFEQ